MGGTLKDITLLTLTSRSVVTFTSVRGVDFVTHVHLPLVVTRCVLFLTRVGKVGVPSSIRFTIRTWTVSLRHTRVPVGVGPVEPRPLTPVCFLPYLGLLCSRSFPSP